MRQQRRHEAVVARALAEGVAHGERCGLEMVCERIPLRQLPLLRLALRTSRARSRFAKKAAGAAREKEERAQKMRQLQAQAKRACRATACASATSTDCSARPMRSLPCSERTMKAGSASLAATSSLLMSFTLASWLLWPSTFAMALSCSNTPCTPGILSRICSDLSLPDRMQHPRRLGEVLHRAPKARTTTLLKSARVW